MNSIKGPGTLSFDDGTIYEVEADLKFQSASGQSFWSGTIRSQEVFSIAMKSGQPELEVGQVKIRVVIKSAGSEGIATVTSSGPPIKN